jgi:dephospho-CoA kinase
MLRLAIYGLSGSGKSTTAKIIEDYYQQQNKSVEFIKLAYPLYKIQQTFYETAGKPIDFYDQDQVLLEVIADQLRRISKSALVDDFITRLQACRADVAINDDIRDYRYDYPVLKREKFIFCRVFCDEQIRLDRLKARNDITVQVNSKTTLDLDKFEPEWEIDTSTGDLALTKQKIHHLLKPLRI